MAQPLLDNIAAFDLSMLLPQGIPTLEATLTKNYTRPDNIFASTDIADRLLTCDTAPALRPPCTDHLPISLSLDVTPHPARETPRRNFREVDWEDFRTCLKGNIDSRMLGHGELTTLEQFNVVLKNLSDAISETIKATVPLSRPPPFTKRWWSQDLAKSRRAVQRLARVSYKHRNTHDHPSHAEYRKIRNRYGDEIKSAKQDHWEAWLESADPDSIWTINRFTAAGPSDGSRPRVPSLKDGNAPAAEENEAKSGILYRAFFPPPGPPPSLPATHRYPKLAFHFSPITDEQIAAAVKRLKELKVPGPDEASNEVYKHCIDLLLLHLGRLFRATFTLNTYPSEWKISNTAALRKPGRPDYAVAKAYRPIALLNCIGKILSACVADVLVYESETHGLLARNHFGGRPGRCSTDSLHLLVKTVKDAWRRGQVVSILFLDIKAAFPSANLERLFHNMRSRGIPKEIVNWLRQRLTGRHTRILFDDFKSALFEIINGIDQGCPLSVILYEFYNSDLFEIAYRIPHSFALGYIDDAAIIATGKDYIETHEILRRYMDEEGGAMTWSNEHQSEFSLDKFGLLNMSAMSPDLGPSLQLQTANIQPLEAHKFLGVTIDRRLRFHQQVAGALAKGFAWVQQFRRLARTSGGIPFSHMRRLYLSIAVPRILYAADVFLVPLRNVPGRKSTYGSVGAIKKLARVQRQATLLIMGAMRTTASDVLEAHANLLPFALLIDKHCHRAAVHLCTLPPSHPLHVHVKKASARYIKHHRSPLHELLETYQLDPDKTETISPIRYSPSWSPSFQVSVADSKDSALKEEARWAEKHGIRVYSDGSDIDSGVGAAAVLYRGDRANPKVLRFYLGKSSEHTVYEAEVVGFILGVKLIHSEFVVYSASCAGDNKASVRATRLRRPAPSHYLLDVLHRDVDLLIRKHKIGKSALTVRWVPGHKDVEGNERADLEAKKAARGDPSPLAMLPKSLQSPLPLSSSKLRQSHLECLKSKAATAWKGSERGHAFSRIDPSLPSPKFEKLVADLPRRHASLLIQLRTGHAPLNVHLHRIKCSPTKLCPACNGRPESVQHFLLSCPSYRRQRDVLTQELGRPARSLAKLLTSPRAVKPLFRYIHATGRFSTVFNHLNTFDKCRHARA
ncbi:RNA-directed DNA polymerase from mobile element jockey [Sparassis crispa]|uniref:RNA-directed DNA polymerase from mobile element jockey n=1 Tax=Sparassis crispa TaxID=139825 RepID=A0A401H559_9APHY|nr:RNA-directed DNA polymerase from mobile element jockey [Sparassis crispa]GBE89552.1 RNA-directed DNA polymerase from mobile element jockey [Sparassis crispa]